jgi:hypothetical protein
MPKRKEQPQVIVHSQKVYEQDIPYPVVHYPKYYGTFSCYSEKMDPDIYFCSCDADLIENTIKIDQSLRPIAAVGGSFIMASMPNDVIGRSIVYSDGVVDCMSSKTMRHICC